MVNSYSGRFIISLLRNYMTTSEKIINWVGGDFNSWCEKKKQKFIKENTPKCKECNDEGVIEKTEWTGDDESYEVVVKCMCQED